MILRYQYLLFFVHFQTYKHTLFYQFFRPEHDSKDEKKDGGKGQIDIGKEAAIEAEVRAARERAIVPLEIRMKQFRDMLAEKEVNFLFLY